MLSILIAAFTALCYYNSFDVITSLLAGGCALVVLCVLLYLAAMTGYNPLLREHVPNPKLETFFKLRIDGLVFLYIFTMFITHTLLLFVIYLVFSGPIVVVLSALYLILAWFVCRSKWLTFNIHKHLMRLHFLLAK